MPRLNTLLRILSMNHVSCISEFSSLNREADPMFEDSSRIVEAVFRWLMREWISTWQIERREADFAWNLKYLLALWNMSSVSAKRVNLALFLRCRGKSVKINDKKTVKFATMTRPRDAERLVHPDDMINSPTWFLRTVLEDTLMR